MRGWNGKLLRVNLSTGRVLAQEYSRDVAQTFLGGRGFAIRLLWDELESGTRALSPENKLIFAAGPLTGFPLPSSGKLVVAAKSPLTGGYGDGNVGTRAAVQLREAGYDLLVVEGEASRPTVLRVEDEESELLSGEDYWGLGPLETEERLRKEYGRTVGVVTIGPAGENLVKFANVVSQEGRAGGRPGMGAVMGSKNLKALVLKGSKTIPVADSDRLKELGKEGYREVLEKPNYEFWKRQGTMATIEWSQENSVLPTQNFREGVFEEAEDIGGFAMEELKVSQRGCPQCNMTCGNVIEDAEGQESELDYENVAMLGSNIGLGHLKQVGVLNRLADDYGVDTISLGNVLGFAMEASEKGLLDYRIEWGDFQAAKALTEDIVHRRGVGSVLAEGTQAAAQKLGGEASTWAMNIKSLEITGYDCHAAPGMALSFGTSPIGAHHKDAWVISWEMKVGRGSYTEAKVEKVIEFQRIRGGIFECLTTCRLPWIEVGFKLEWYPKFLKAATGMDLSLGDLFRIADRVYSLMRAFWVREYGKAWDHKMDVPPARWFRQPLTEGPFKGATLDREKYQDMLQRYYRKRGWDQRGVPTKNTLAHLGLPEVAEELSQYIKLTP